MPKYSSTLSSIIKRRSLPALLTLSSAIIAAVLYLNLTPSLYKVTGRLMLNDRRISLSELGRDLSTTPASTQGGPNPVANQAELLRSQRVLEAAVNKVLANRSNSSEKKLVVRKLKRKLNIKIIPATNILELTYEDPNPSLATKLINAVSQSAVEISTESLRLEVKSVRDFLQAEVPKKRIEVEAAENAENQYRRSSGIIDSEDQKKSLIESLTALNDRQSDLFSQVQEAREKSKELKKVSGSDNIQSAYINGRIGQDRELSLLRSQLVELDVKLAQERSRYQDKAPNVAALIQSRSALLKLYSQKSTRLSNKDRNVRPFNVTSDELSQKITSEYILSETGRISLEKKLAALQTKQAELQDRLTQLPMKQQPLTLLIRRREEATSSLKLLQNKLEEARIAESQLVGDLRTIEQAEVPLYPSSPNIQVVMLLAIVFGIILAIGLVLLLEAIDKRFWDVTDGVFEDSSYHLENRPEQRLPEFVKKKHK